MNPYGPRILVLIPHPDDEVVGCFAALAHARAAGHTIFGLYLGHGCVAREALWPWQRGDYATRVNTRMTEAMQVANFMGLRVAGENRARPARAIWQELPQVMDEVNAAIRNVQPTHIWVPAYEGGNPDHDALNALASTLKGPQVFEFAEYHLAGGRPHYNAFIHPRGDETVLELSLPEQTAKRQALEMYASEQGNIGGLGIRYEALRYLAGYDYAARPYPGKLWYERFQWVQLPGVPFKHPRVDYTKSAEVSAAIMRFLARA